MNKIKTIRSRAGSQVDIYSGGGKFHLQATGKRPPAIVHRDPDTGTVIGVERPPAPKSDLVKLDRGLNAHDAHLHAFTMLRTMDTLPVADARSRLPGGFPDIIADWLGVMHPPAIKTPPAGS